MISYEPFWNMMKERGIHKIDLIRTYQLSSNLLYRMSHNHSISAYTVNILCTLFDCRVEDIMVYIKEDTDIWLITDNKARLIEKKKSGRK